MYLQSTTIRFNESADFQGSEESAPGDVDIVYHVPEWMLEDLAKNTTSQTSESADFQDSEESAAGEVIPVYRMPEPYHKLEGTLEEVTKHYEKLLDIKESEIEKLFNELSELKKEDQRQNREPKQIQSQYKEEIAKIPEVQQALYKQNQREIQFLVVLDDMRRDIFDPLGEIQDRLEASFTSWLFDFEYIGHRISSQQHQNAYIEFFTRD